MKYFVVIIIIFFASFSTCYSQNYDISGTATATTNNCFVLTNGGGQAGAVWNSNLIDLTQPLDITLILNFGSVDADTWSSPPCGADGISFVLQPIGTGVSTSGGGAGYSGITPSFGVVMDTYSANPTDPLGDHISIHQNGDQLHATANELVSYASAIGFPYNVEDGQDHIFRFIWTPGGNAEIYFDGVLTLSYSGDIITDIFGGDPNVFWGVSASTGGCWNVQTVCLEIVSDFTAPMDSCSNVPIQFTDASYSGTTINLWAWDFGDGNTSDIQSPIHTYDAAGTYTVALTVENIAGLTSTMTYDINISEAQVTLATSANPICIGDMISLTGIGADTYIWDNGVTDGELFAPPLGTTTYTVTGTDSNGCIDTENIDIIVNPDATPSITSDIEICNGLTGTLDAGNYDIFDWSTSENTQIINITTAGTYDLTVTDSNGCTGTASIVVDEGSELEITETVQDVDCFGQNNGEIQITVTGGVLPLSYSWSNMQETQNLTNLQEGLYTVTVSDANDCTISDTYEVVQPDEIITIITPQDVLCFGNSTGEIEFEVNGGVLPYQFNWSNGADSQNLTDIPYGNYFVTLTDANDCSVFENAYVQQPDFPLETEITPTHIACFSEENGIVDLVVSGGSEPYSFEWSNMATSEDLIDVGIGNYTVIVTDNNACTSTNSVEIEQPPLLVSTVISSSDISCYGENDGYINVNVIGGTLPYYYSWSNGNAFQNLLEVEAGNYILTVTDLNGCTVSNSVVLEQPEELITILNSENISCYGENSGQVILNVAGGTFPYQYSWNNAVTTQSLLDVFPGNYIVTVTDANGCSVLDYVQITQPSFPLHGEITATDIRCFGDQNGEADLLVSGGTEPYLFEWSNSEISEDIFELVPGNYTVTITDNNGCSTTDDVQIVQSDSQLTGIIYGSPVSCNGGDDGNVYINVSGGRLPYHFEWNTGSWQQNLIGVEVGLYTVTVTDDSDCHYIMTFDVVEPDVFYIQAMDNPTICYGVTTEIGIGIITGNVPPYTIVWSNDDIGMTTFVNPLETTTYSAYIVDNNNCVSENIDIIVNVLDSISMEVSPFVDTVCPYTPVSFDVSIQGGGIIADSVFVNDTLMALPISLEIYSDTVLNFVIYDACEFDSVLVSIPMYTYPLPPVHVIADQYSGCAPLTVQFNETSDDFGQTYIWNFDDGDFENLSFDKSPLHTFFNSQTYHVNLEVTSPLGCVNDTIVGITVFPIPDAGFVASSTNISMSNPIVNFSNYTSGGFFYYWDFGDGSNSSVSDPSHSYLGAGVYDVVLSTASLYGCVDTAMVQIQVRNEMSIYAPTAFTPNHDDLNEEFKVIIANFDSENYILTVYSRWGEVVFESEEYEEGWNGRMDDMICNPGSYIWIVSFSDLYENKYTMTGHFTLIR